jgi:plastocyanin
MRLDTVLSFAMTAALASTGCSGTAEPTVPAGDVTIVLNASNKGTSAFSPNPFTESFATRAAVIWVNSDLTSGSYGSTGTAHHLVSDGGLFDSGVIAPGKSYTFSFAASGTYSYHCSIHSTMVGTITITP